MGFQQHETYKGGNACQESCVTLRCHTPCNDIAVMGCFCDSGYYRNTVRCHTAQDVAAASANSARDYRTPKLACPRMIARTIHAHFSPDSSTRGTIRNFQVYFLSLSSFIPRIFVKYMKGSSLRVESLPLPRRSSKQSGYFWTSTREAP